MKIGNYDVGQNKEEMTTREFDNEKRIMLPSNPEPETRKEVDINKLFTEEPLVDTLGYYQKAKTLMEENKGKNFIDRAINNQDSPTLGNSTHRMAYAGPDNDGEYIIYPEVVQKRGEDTLHQLDADEAHKYAKENDEFIKVGKDPFFANYMSQVGYKYAFPKDVYEEALNNYIDSW